MSTGSREPRRDAAQARRRLRPQEMSPWSSCPPAHLLSRCASASEEGSGSRGQPSSFSPPSEGLDEGGPFSVSVFTAAVWCVPALRVPLVHSLINHFRQNYIHLSPQHMNQCPRFGETTDEMLPRTPRVTPCLARTLSVRSNTYQVQHCTHACT